MSAAKAPTAKLPTGWSVELLGLIDGVVFRGPGRKELLWSGAWTLSTNGVTRHASLPVARSQREARRIGTAFLVECFA